MLRRSNPIQERRREAERTLPVRLTIPIPPHGLGKSLNEMMKWLDDNVGKESYAWLPAPIRGMDAVHLYLEKPHQAQEFGDHFGIGASRLDSSQ